MARKHTIPAQQVYTIIPSSWSYNNVYSDVSKRNIIIERRQQSDATSQMEYVSLEEPSTIQRRQSAACLSSSFVWIRKPQILMTTSGWRPNNLGNYCTRDRMDTHGTTRGNYLLTKRYTFWYVYLSIYLSVYLSFSLSLSLSLSLSRAIFIAIRKTRGIAFIFILIYRMNRMA